MQTLKELRRKLSGKKKNQTKTTLGLIYTSRSVFTEMQQTRGKTLFFPFVSLVMNVGV